ncbi:hypothetical protein CYMTET_53464 [Cymbomonas tetramitiformis]|uniref:ABC transporter domain-containing protein n=1 Tax=Cymbomonas tetramitiformis TaxID=36881 RepID=A0AAE0EQB7_9CHLO|nr:hypothetical protein CYMTET_53464 [Cymbomonas tetramitiformis]
MLSEGEYELTSLVPEDGKDNSEEGAAADVRELRNTRGVYHWNQLKTLLWKHLLFKMRSPAQTLGEIFSPVLLICVLVYAFSYTYVHHYDAEIYANQTEFASLNYEERTLLDCTALVAQEDGTNQTAEDFARLLGDNLDWGTILEDPTDPLLWSQVISALSGKVDGGGGQAGMPSMQELQAEKRTYEELQSLLRCMQRNTTRGLSHLLGDIQYHNGPLPVVPFDGYVSTSMLFTQMLKQNRRIYHRVVISTGRIAGGGDIGGADAGGGDIDGLGWVGLSRAGCRNITTHHGWNIFGNLLDLGRLAFAAETPEGVPGMARFMRARWTQFDSMFRKRIFESEEEALDFAMGAGAGKLWAVVVFRNVPMYGNASVEPVHSALDYSIRMNFSVVPKTWMVVDILHNYLRTDYKMYYTSGFLSIQAAVDEYAMLRGSISSAREHRAADSRAAAKQAAARGQSAPNDVDVSEALGSASEWGAPMPLAEYNLNPFYKAVGPVLGLVMCLSTLYPLCMLIRGLVEERETRQREVMLIMGLREPLLVASWSITYGVVFGLSAFLCTTVVHYSFFPSSSYSLLLVFFLSFMLSEIPFAFLVASFFSRAKLAAIVGPFLQFMAVMPRYIFFKATDGQAGSGKLMASVLSPTAFTFGADTVGLMEGSSQGIFWASLDTGDPGLGNIILLMLLDGVLYAVLAWLVHYASSKQDYLKDAAVRMLPRALRSRVFASLDGEHGEDAGTFASDVEQPSLGDEHLEPYVRIQGLRKTYKGVEAVKGLDLDIHADQMTALLGHNGAGKTTTISMLTGMVAPTAGDCVVMGRSIRWDKHLARRNVGICPQHNVLFERITVREHLVIYGALKGVPANEMEAQVANWIDEIGLSDKALAYASSLSGGMKRKLQVGLAMIGDSKVVLLDEPTSGMDPVSRRSLWQLLQRCKQGRAVVLTTHYMDEADLLCDSIVILNRGQVRCRGSSLFLKSRFGVGYTLSLTLSRCGAAVGKAVGKVVRKHVAEAEFIRAVAAELTFRLPLDATPLFPDLFRELEEEGAALGVASFGVSMTTLEDVFLHLGDEAAAAEAEDGKPLSLEAVELSEVAAGGRGAHPASVPAEEAVGEQEQERAALVEVELGLDAAEADGQLPRQHCGFFQSVELMLLKRALVASRDMKAMAHFVLLPVVVVSLVLMILHMDFSPAGPALTLNAYLYTDGSRVQYVAFEGWHRYSGDSYSTTEARSAAQHALDRSNSTASIASDGPPIKCHVPTWIPDGAGGSADGGAALAAWKSLEFSPYWSRGDHAEWL